MFFYYELRTNTVQKQFHSLANGTTVDNLNSELVRDVRIFIPPIELQNQFADYAQSCDKLKFEAEERLDSLRNEREELVNKYFK